MTLFCEACWANRSWSRVKCPPTSVRGRSGSSSARGSASKSGWPSCAPSVRLCAPGWTAAASETFRMRETSLKQLDSSVSGLRAEAVIMTEEQDKPGAEPPCSPAGSSSSMSPEESDSDAPASPAGPGSHAALMITKLEREDERFPACIRDAVLRCWRGYDWSLVPMPARGSARSRASRTSRDPWTPHGFGLKPRSRKLADQYPHLHNAELSKTLGKTLAVRELLPTHFNHSCITYINT